MLYHLSCNDFINFETKLDEYVTLSNNTEEIFKRLETIEKLKGKITVKSKTRYGTTFKVVLPNLKERYDAAPKLEE